MIPNETSKTIDTDLFRRRNEGLVGLILGFQLLHLASEMANRFGYKRKKEKARKMEEKGTGT